MDGRKRKQIELVAINKKLDHRRCGPISAEYEADLAEKFESLYGAENKLP